MTRPRDRRVSGRARHLAHTYHVRVFLFTASPKYVCTRMHVCVFTDACMTARPAFRSRPLALPLSRGGVGSPDKQVTKPRAFPLYKLRNLHNVSIQCSASCLTRPPPFVWASVCRGTPHLKPAWLVTLAAFHVFLDKLPLADHDRMHRSTFACYTRRH